MTHARAKVSQEVNRKWSVGCARLFQRTLCSYSVGLRCTEYERRGNREVWGGGSNNPLEICLGVKHGILTPDFWERNIFWYTGQLILSKIIKIVATSCHKNAPNSIWAGGGANYRLQRNMAIITLTPSQKIVPTCLWLCVIKNVINVFSFFSAFWSSVVSTNHFSSTFTFLYLFFP